MKSGNTRVNSSLHSIIKTVSEENLEKLTLMVDKIAELKSTEAFVASNQSNNLGYLSNQAILHMLIAKIEAVEKRLDKFNIRSQPSSRSTNSSGATSQRSNSSSRSRDFLKRRFNPRGKYCYYHCFGSRCQANTCRAPYSYRCLLRFQ